MFSVCAMQLLWEFSVLLCVVAMVVSVFLVCYFAVAMVFQCFSAFLSSCYGVLVCYHGCLNAFSVLLWYF